MSFQTPPKEDSCQLNFRGRDRHSREENAQPWGEAEEGQDCPLHPSPAVLRPFHESPLPVQCWGHGAAAEGVVSQVEVVRVKPDAHVPDEGEITLPHLLERNSHLALKKAVVGWKLQMGRASFALVKAGQKPSRFRGVS